MRRVVCFVLVVGLMVISHRVHAFERQWHAGIDFGYAGVTWRDQFRKGLGGGLHGAYGLTDAYNLLLEVGASTHFVDSEDCEGCPNLRTGHAAMGMAYTLDVISWVPYMGLLVGGYRFWGAEQAAEFKLGFQGALGCDYRPSRSWAVGLQARYHTFSDAPFTANYLTVFARFELLWGW